MVVLFKTTTYHRPFRDKNKISLPPPPSTFAYFCNFRNKALKKYKSLYYICSLATPKVVLHQRAEVLYVVVLQLYYLHTTYNTMTDQN